ncbi:MAG TPA: hypothetical protein VNB06_15695 [Thermoanaerobaculia bacterium]|nr:hypothetical protein [Thermoanaerobaculia bacterium]
MSFTTSLIDPRLFAGGPREVTVSTTMSVDPQSATSSQGTERQNGSLSIIAYVTIPNPPTIQAFRLTTDEFGGGCIPGAHTACPSGFTTTVDWEDFEENTGQATVVPGGTATSSLFWFFSPDNWEMLLKVLDGCGINDHWWVFFAAATNVGYEVVVSDDELGSVTYTNPLGKLAPAVTDIGAIPCSEAQMAAARERLARDPEGVVTDLARALGELDDRSSSRRGTLPPSSLEPAALGAGLDTSRSFSSSQDCVDSATAICLNNRFLAEVTWTDFEGASGAGTVAPLRSADSGLFWFFGPDNWELLVKVLDGCGFNDRFWVLGAATTNVEYTLTITDTETEAVWTRTNPLGVSSPAIADIDAFAGCP